MRWRVFGASQSTGEDVELILEATTVSDAERKANSMGIAVEKVQQIDGQTVDTLQPSPAHVAELPDDEVVKVIDIDKAMRAIGKNRPPHTWPLAIIFRVLAVLLLVIGLPTFVGYTCTTTLFQGDGPAKPETRSERIGRQFSSWDGSHRKLTEFINSMLRDPGSYEHIATSYRDMTDYLLVTTRYRARNGFGGMGEGSVTAKVGLDGDIIGIVASSE